MSEEPLNHDGLFGLPLVRQAKDGTWPPRPCDTPVHWYGTLPGPQITVDGPGARDGDVSLLYDPSPTRYGPVRRRLRRWIGVTQ